MALTLFDLDAGPPVKVNGGKNPLRMVIKRVTFDSSYVTGGEPLTAANLGLASVVAAFATGATGYKFGYDTTNSKLLAYRSGASGTAFAEVGNTVDLSAIVCTIVAFGLPSSNE